MGRTRRYIEPGKPYELILRVKEGLPFRPGPLINTLLLAAMARAQRDNKVTICHYLWMGNHAHIILIPKCPQACVNFYQELQKKITDSFKRLLGKRRLNMWEGDPVLAQILDPQKAMDRVAYLYANPAKANLVNTIDEYCGASSWSQFVMKTKAPELPWIRLPKIRKLPSLYLSKSDEENRLHEITSEEVEMHPLDTKPDELFHALGVDTDMLEQILERIKAKELEARNIRIAEGKSPLSKNHIQKQRIFAPHLPKRKPSERRIFVLSSVNELRVSFIIAFKEFCSRCSFCYQLLKQGIADIPWPRQAFRPYSLCI